jgi:hypothetical protein
MDWDEPVDEAEEDVGFAGSLRQYVGQTLELTSDNDSYRLRYGSGVLGVLTRPGDNIVAETREGRWELRHPRRSVARIAAVDAVTGADVARYRRRLLRPGASITGGGPTRFTLRKTRREGWVVTQSDNEILRMRAPADDVEVELTVLREPDLPSDLAPVTLLCCYVALLALATYIPGPPPDGVGV